MYFVKLIHIWRRQGTQKSLLFKNKSCNQWALKWSVFVQYSLCVIMCLDYAKIHYHIMCISWLLCCIMVLVWFIVFHKVISLLTYVLFCIFANLSVQEYIALTGTVIVSIKGRLSLTSVLFWFALTRPARCSLSWIKTVHYCNNLTLLTKDHLNLGCSSLLGQL